MTAAEKAIKLLKEKAKYFIGQNKNEAIAFKQGIVWAIDTIETEIQNEKAQEKWRLEQLENENKLNL